MAAFAAAVLLPLLPLLMPLPRRQAVAGDRQTCTSALSYLLLLVADDAPVDMNHIRQHICG
jgi:hypothetical protein